MKEALVREINLDTYLTLYQDQSLLWRLPRASISLWPSSEQTHISYPLEKRGNYEKLRIQTVKILLDGVMESKTAYLHKNYLQWYLNIKHKLII